MAKSWEEYENLLPEDDELLCRSKKWAQLFEKYNQNDNEDNGISFHEIPDLYGENSETDDDEEESIPPSEFEDKVHQDDPTFDVQNVLNNTMKVVAKRKENWHKMGVDQLMNSFYIDRYTDKVDEWLSKHTDYFLKGTKRRDFCCNGAVPCIDEVQIKDKHVYVENGSDDSFQSVDTAKYILSNRKKQRTRVRTMTIKRYCFSRRRMEEIEKENLKRYSCKNLSPAVSESCLRKQSCQYRPDHSAYSPRKCKSEYRRKPKKRFRRNSPSSSSASSYSSGSKIEYHERVPHPIGVSKKRRFKPFSKLPHDLEPSSPVTSKIGRVTPGKKRLNQIDSDFSKVDDDNVDSLNCESRFCPENVVNSTALSEQQIQSEQNRDNLPAIKEHISVSSGDSCPLPETIKTPIENSKKRSLTPTPIVIYDPENTSANSINKSIVDGKLVITSKILEETIGTELAKIYLGEKTDFSLSCDLQSKILFYPPNIETSDSEADILETMCFNKRGQIVNIVNSL